MAQRCYIITFDGSSPIDAHRYVDELGNSLLDATTDITIQRKQADSRAQNFGTDLVLILGAPATIVLAKTIGTAIENWLKLRSSASLTIKTADEQILLQNVTSKQASQLAQIFLSKEREEHES